MCDICCNAKITISIKDQTLLDFHRPISHLTYDLCAYTNLDLFAVRDPIRESWVETTIVLAN